MDGALPQPNGAGKTTLIKCITGAEATRMDDGDVFVAEKSCKTELDNARKFMGVCPQFDALLEDLLGKRATCENKGHTMGKIRPGGPSKLHGDVGATP